MNNFWKLVTEIDKLPLDQRKLLRMRIDQSIVLETGEFYETKFIKVEPEKTPLYKQGYKAGYDDGLDEAVAAHNAQSSLYGNWYGAASKFDALVNIAKANGGQATVEVIKELSGELMGYSKKLDSTVRQIRNRPLKVVPNLEGLDEFREQIKLMERKSRTFFDLSGQPDIAQKWFRDSIQSEDFDLSNNMPTSSLNIRGAKTKDRNWVTVEGEILVDSGKSYQRAVNKLKGELEQELRDVGYLSDEDAKELALLQKPTGAQMLRRRIDRKKKRESAEKPRTK
jgi:hypothetical protein